MQKRLTSFGTSRGSDYPQNNWQNPRYGFEWSTNQSARNSWSHRYIARYSVFNFVRKVDWLFGKRTNDNWSVLYVVIAPVEQSNQEKTSLFEKEKDSLLLRQSTGAHLRSFDGKNYGIEIRIISTTTVFTGFHHRWLFFISKLEKMARRTTAHVYCRGHRSNRCPFWGPSEILLFGRLKKVGETFGKVYRVKKRLCWKMKKKSTRNNWSSYLFLRTYWTTLVHTIHGRRRIGRLRLKYVIQIIDDLGCSGYSWMKRLAQDRNGWRVASNQS